MMLGVSYIVFDGAELLEHTMRQIREYVDFVHVLYQKKSWFGHDLPDGDLEILHSVRESGLADELSEFTDFEAIPGHARAEIMRSKSYEMKKRQTSLYHALRRGCSHHLCMDVDEFYVGSEFLKAKNRCGEEGLGCTAVRFINYLRPDLHRGYDQNSVPFICRIGEGSRHTGEFFTRCDPTRGVSPSIGKNYAFPPEEVTMHHMETVRNNLGLKYRATTRLVMDRNRTDELVDRIRCSEEQADFGGIIFPNVGKVRLHRCENLFGIRSNP